MVTNWTCYFDFIYLHVHSKFYPLVSQCIIKTMQLHPYRFISVQILQIMLRYFHLLLKLKMPVSHTSCHGTSGHKAAFPWYILRAYMSQDSVVGIVTGYGFDN